MFKVYYINPSNNEEVWVFGTSSELAAKTYIEDNQGIYDETLDYRWED